MGFVNTARASASQLRLDAFNATRLAGCSEKHFEKPKRSWERWGHRQDGWKFEGWKCVINPDFEAEHKEWKKDEQERKLNPIKRFVTAGKRRDHSSKISKILEYQARCATVALEMVKCAERLDQLAKELRK